MPSTKPRTIAGTASRSVPPAKLPKPKKPWTMRNLKLLVTTSRLIVGLDVPWPSIVRRSGEVRAEERGDLALRIVGGRRRAPIERVADVGIDGERHRPAARQCALREALTLRRRHHSVIGGEQQQRGHVDVPA